MTQPSINDSIVQLINSELANSTGTFTHTGDYIINGTLNATTINVANLITEQGAAISFTGNWATNLDSQLNGLGFNWTWAEGNTQLIYRAGGRLWTNGMFDMAAGSSYNIDGIPVLSSNSLGSSITNSNLTSIGTLSTLQVSGNANLGDVVFVDSNFNRLGIGTDEPSASLNILDNNVDIVIGSPSVNLAHVGTASNHDLAIVTDNLARITVKGTGQVNIGDPVNGGGILNVYGTLFATTVQTDNRIDRTHPLQFTATPDTSIYGLGMVWSGTGYTRQLIMMGGPDRLWTTENFDLAANQSYMINAQTVLSATGLGPTVTSSNLTSLGALQSLSVTGPATFIGGIDASQSSVKVQSLVLNDGTNSLNFSTTGINVGTSISVSLQQNNIVYADTAQINIGEKTLQSKPVKIFGPLSINVNNPDPTLQFTVNGDVSIGGKRFTSGVSAPATGTFNAGDMCWNSAPGPNSYVGWVCVTAGSPGQWLGFGMIASQ
jgi:hypothetical protein